MIPLLFSLFLPLSNAERNLAVESTVWIRAGDRSVGTGWVVDAARGWVITARHVVADRDRVDVYFRDRVEGRSIADRDYYLRHHDDLLKRGRLVTGTVHRKLDEADLALIHISSLPKDVRSLGLSTSPCNPGDSCYSIGHRHDAERLWNRTDGHIRQAGQLANGYFWAGKRIGTKVPILLVQSPIESGESGAALLNSAGEVIGLVSAVSNRTPGLAFAIDVSVIRKLLQEARKDQRVEPVSKVLEKRPDVEALAHATVWIRPQATDGRHAGVLIHKPKGLILTTATAVKGEQLVDVVAPRWDGERLVAESAAYDDLLGLRLSGHCVRGVVLVRDAVRDLALIQLERIPKMLKSVPLAESASMGDRVASMSHPTGEELQWLFAAGNVRASGRILLRRDRGDESAKVAVNLLQLPHQGSASGGPVVDREGKLIGVLATREGSRQELAYAATADEIREMLKTHVAIWQPTTASEWQKSARFLEHHGWYMQSLAADVEAAKLALDDNIVQATLARSLVQNGQAEAGRQILGRLSKLAKRTAECDAILAESHVMLGERDRAKVAVDAALKAKPTLAEALITRATLRSGTEARGDIGRAIEIDGSNPRAYLVRSTLYASEDPNRANEAIVDLTRSIELRPANATAIRLRANLYAEVKDFKKAAKDWERLTELRPLDAENWQGLADAKFQAGDRASASKALAACIRVEPKRTATVLRAAREFGNRLVSDNPADTQRVADWFTMVGSDLLPWLDELRKPVLGAGLTRSEKLPHAKRMELLVKLFEELEGLAK